MSSRSRRNQLAREQQRATQIQGTFASVTRSGPLPTPEDFERYDAVVPGMGERLLAKFEQQADHRMRLEDHTIRADVRRADRGLIAGFVFGVLVLVAAVYLIVNGHEGPGTGLLIVEFLAFAGAFLYSNITRRRERNQKAAR